MKTLLAACLCLGLATAGAQLIPDPSGTTARGGSTTNYLTLDAVTFDTNNSSASFEEFYVTGTGNNLNSGHTTDNAATFSATGGFWTNATGVFQKAGLSPVAGGVTNGAWASVYPDAATTNVYIGRVTAVSDVSNTIVVSLSFKVGTAPANDTAGATSIKVGGAWKGPNTNNVNSYDKQFPFDGVAGTMTGASGLTPRVNFKNSVIYYLTNGMAQNKVGPIRFQGYTTTPGDGGKAIFDGSAISANFLMFNMAANFIDLDSFIFRTNGTAAVNNTLLAVGSGRSTVSRCVFIGSAASGITANGCVVFECEAYNCGRANSAGQAAFLGSGTGSLFVRCISHDNPTTGTGGFCSTGQSTYLDCISFNNRVGYQDASATGSTWIGCDAYSNTLYGIELADGGVTTTIYAANCNFFRNGNYGINSPTTRAHDGLIQNCMFGSGTQTNVLGSLGTNMTLTITAATDRRNLGIYTANLTPWVDPTNGNFTIKTTAGTRSLGRGNYTQLLIASPTNTVSFPDIGAAQGSDTNAIIVQ